MTASANESSSVFKEPSVPGAAAEKGVREVCDKTFTKNYILNKAEICVKSIMYNFNDLL